MDVSQKYCTEENNQVSDIQRRESGGYFHHLQFFR